MALLFSNRIKSIFVAIVFAFFFFVVSIKNIVQFEETLKKNQRGTYRTALTQETQAYIFGLLLAMRIQAIVFLSVF